jgi:hypothetical protein
MWSSTEGVFSSRKILALAIITLSFVFANYCLMIDCWLLVLRSEDDAFPEIGLVDMVATCALFRCTPKIEIFSLSPSHQSLDLLHSLVGNHEMNLLSLVGPRLDNIS